MPAHKVTFKNGANGVVYVYYTIRAYRNSTGKPTSDEVAIGKKDLDTGMLIPNARYFEFFPQEQADADTPPQLNRIASCGNIIALLAIAEKTGLKKVLEKCFPDKWAQMLAVAFYMLCEGNVMMYLADWFDDTEVPFTNAIDGQRCSELFASITNDERMRFFLNGSSCGLNRSILCMMSRLSPPMPRGSNKRKWVITVMAKSYRKSILACTMGPLHVYPYISQCTMAA
jgi:hypothetical protein